MQQTPVLFIIFNRPHYTVKSLAAIRKAKPEKLYIAADGPRSSKEGEKELCEQTRELVLNSIDWKCEVKTLFQKKNLGCGLGVSTGISWFFEHEESGIIIEDDIVANLSFFRFCSEMLQKYEDSKNIWTICGYNYRCTSELNESYFFTKTFFPWGWATWRDRWKYFSLNVRKLKENILDWYTKNKRIKEHYSMILWRQQNTNTEFHIDTWDYQYFFISISHRVLHIYPQKNLVKNIGEFGVHFTGKSKLINLKTFKLDIINHPKKVKNNQKLQDYLEIDYRSYPQYPKVPNIEGKKIYIWGTGAFASKVLFLTRKYKITAFLDRLQKQECYGHKILHPEKILKGRNRNFFIFIASTKYACEIENTLKSYGLKKGKDFWSPIISKEEKMTKSKIYVNNLLKNNKNIKIEFGAGNKHGENDWITIDICDKSDIWWDLRDGIPFPDNSVSKIYSSHFLEHLTFKEGQLFLKECLRVLKSNGIFSICVPNARIYIKAYIQNKKMKKDKLYLPAYNNTTGIDYVNYTAYMDGHHKYMFDEENLLCILKKAGFRKVKLRSFDENLDLKERDHESIYAEGRKGNP